MELAIVDRKRTSQSRSSCVRTSGEGGGLLAFLQCDRTRAQGDFERLRRNLNNPTLYRMF